MALIALATLPALPATQAAITKPRPLETVPARATDPAVEEAPELSARADKESALEKLALNKLTIERPAPEEPAPAPAPAPEPVPEPEKESKNPPRAGVASVSVLPGPTQKAPAREAPKQQVPKREAPPQNAPEKRPQAPAKKPKPVDTRLQLSVPRLGLENVTIGDSPEQAFLDQEGIMHLSETGFPFERGSNTYIAGHAGGFDRSRIPNVFRNLKDLRRGDLITLRDTTGKTYNYRVYERLVVSPQDVWVTEPVAGKKIVSLQTCFPAPTFKKRLVARGQLVS